MCRKVYSLLANSRFLSPTSHMLATRLCAYGRVPHPRAPLTKLCARGMDLSHHSIARCRRCCCCVATAVVFATAVAEPSLSPQLPRSRSCAVAAAAVRRRGRTSRESCARVPQLPSQPQLSSRSRSSTSSRSRRLRSRRSCSRPVSAAAVAAFVICIDRSLCHVCAERSVRDRGRGVCNEKLIYRAHT